MKLVFEQIPVGGDRNFSYLLADRSSKEAIIIDPAFHPEEVVQRAVLQGLVVRYIINTHGHPDHINGNAKAKKLTGASIAAHCSSAIDLDIPLGDNATLSIGELKIKALATPGHAADHLVLFVENWNIAFSGDLIFVGKVGGTSTEKDALTEWQSIQRVISELPPATTIWPGHDYGCRPSSTLELEVNTNPFLLCQNEAEFLALKNDWPNFKAKMGLH